MTYLKLSGGTVYDPTNQVDGVAKDLWVRDGKIVETPTAEAVKSAAKIQTIDVSGRVIMAGAVDMHCHIAGPKVNTARKMQPEQSRAFAQQRKAIEQGALLSGSLGSVPSIFTTGYKYTGLGYTTCFDAAISPLAARHAHFEFDQIPNVDTGFFALVGNNHYVMNAVAKDDQSGLESFLGWLMNRVGAFAPKLVNPGGVELWKQSHNGNARDLDQAIHGFDVTPRKIIPVGHAGRQRVGFTPSGAYPHQQPGNSRQLANDLGNAQVRRWSQGSPDPHSIS